MSYHGFAEPSSRRESMSRIACFHEGCTQPAVGVLEMPNPYGLGATISAYVCEEHKGVQVVQVVFTRFPVCGEQNKTA